MDPLTRRHAKDQMKLFNRVRIHFSQLVNPLTILDDSNSSSDAESPNIAHELQPVERNSDLDSIPELKDEVDLDTAEIPLWLIPSGVTITFRSGQVIFEREQGPPWQEVLAQMLEEQNLTSDNI